MDAAEDVAPRVVVYWRPGCGFCAALRRRIRHVGLAVEEVNIWDDREAAAFVRSVAGGNETVPTVLVGSRAMVNPTMARVLEAVRTDAPQLLPPDVEPAPSGPRRRSWLPWRR